MSDNLKLWHQVEKTPTDQCKPITGKSYKGTSPKPHWIVQKATETFGPCGIGWGFTVDERIEDGAMIAPGFYERMHVAKVKVWYIWNGQKGEVEHIGGTPFSGQRKAYEGKPAAIYTDEDAPKKSVTDALVKALSMIGFAGDIFMGRYDDSKYVNELRQEEAEERRDAGRQQSPPSNVTPFDSPPAPKEPAVSTKAVNMGRALKECRSIADLKAFRRTSEWKAFAAAANAVDMTHVETVGETRWEELEAALPTLAAG